MVFLFQQDRVIFILREDLDCCEDIKAEMNVAEAERGVGLTSRVCSSVKLTSFLTCWIFCTMYPLVERIRSKPHFFFTNQ
jgi:hypothetical protein